MSWRVRDGELFNRAAGKWGGGWILAL